MNFSLFSSYYFPWLYCVDFSVASLYSLFYVTREFHKFLHWGWVVSKTKHSKTKTEACSTQISKTKHPKLETTVGWRTTTLSLAWRKPNQMEATDASAPPNKGPQIHPKVLFQACQLFNWTFLDRKSCIISLAILDTSYLNMHFFSTHTCLAWDNKSTSSFVIFESSVLLQFESLGHWLKYPGKISQWKQMSRLLSFVKKNLERIFT